ncbi:hypothetical protein GIS00_24735 [Nakamurella sp. YIM 132087]|uniref:Helicase-associated domain-containing protein n=1 Tax=Nakamurella alba TaxID=2665158 RepID=A0A7K1FSL7_9ACTN|nr:hypothetical protein [Nakamurella alba]
MSSTGSNGPTFRTAAQRERVWITRRRLAALVVAQIISRMRNMTFRRDEACWNARLTELVSFARTNRRLPTAHRQASASERQLIRWLYVQRQHARKELLPTTRLQQLDALLPQWRSQLLEPLIPAMRPRANPQDVPIPPHSGQVPAG